LDVTQEGTDSRQCPSGEVAAAYPADGRSLNYWPASDTEAARASASVDQYESVSTGLGLQHIAMANAYANHVPRPRTLTTALFDVSDACVSSEWNAPGAVNV